MKQNDEYHGQVTFNELLEEDFPKVWQLVKEEGFQKAWKQLTNIPANGNNNPNFYDCSKFIDRCFENGLNNTQACPYVPCIKNIDSPVGMTDKEQWAFTRRVCDTYKELVKTDSSCKRNGNLNRAINAAAAV